MEAAKRFGLEGLVGKRRGSVYESAQRSGAWVKLKFGREETLVIGGYTQSEGGRHYFSSLLLGRPGEEGLCFVGRVGTGFSDQQLKTLHGRFQTMLRPSCPFFNLPAKTRGRWGQGISPAEMKSCTWVEPRLLCKVHFMEWTSEGYIRLPVFLRLDEGSF